METSPSPLGQPKNTNAFYAQSVVAFGVALAAMLAGIFYLPVDPWVRAFLGVGLMYLTTSSFTLAKCVRDAQESQSAYLRGR